mmetsp:Transcript_36761/g.83202  ORF Transcript_36761/g.83202 Transcript_36761/m.83202 type:complete len:292 (-) Transcript_36761:475-1350(-)
MVEAGARRTSQISLGLNRIAIRRQPNASQLSRSSASETSNDQAQTSPTSAICARMVRGSPEEPSARSAKNGRAAWVVKRGSSLDQLSMAALEEASSTVTPDVTWEVRTVEPEVADSSSSEDEGESFTCSSSPRVLQRHGSRRGSTNAGKCAKSTIASAVISGPMNVRHCQHGTFKASRAAVAAAVAAPASVDAAMPTQASANTIEGRPIEERVSAVCHSGGHTAIAVTAAIASDGAEAMRSPPHTPERDLATRSASPLCRESSAGSSARARGGRVSGQATVTEAVCWEKTL